jgi:hypothetical protein
MTIRVEFCGEQFVVSQDSTFVVGRDGDLQVDDNPYLHRQFLMLSHSDGMWWVANVGSQLTATVSDLGGSVQAWLAPGARLPLVFSQTSVRFTAGPTTYEFEVLLEDAPFAALTPEPASSGEETIGPMALTRDQKLLIVALAEPMLLGDGRGMGAVPTSSEAAARLNWKITKFNRKLDNVCQKLEKIGVRGLHGEAGSLASNRRARLIEYALAARLVDVSDLAELDQIDSTVEPS